MEGCTCRSTARVRAGSFVFLIYINDLCDNLNSDVRLFVDDTSLFSVIENEIVGAEELN